MGQQQLLLVILVTIIVGIATVVAINTFGSASKNANKSAVRQDLATIASDAQGYFMKPKQLGGGGHSFTGMTFKKIGWGKTQNMSSSSSIVYNQNGTYQISSASDSSVTVTAAPAQSSGYSKGSTSGTSTTFTATIKSNNFSISQ
ncbi:MAG TPA: hypothetical protein VE868_02440 [Balneolaceae bacterium]|nr:hypothetical protein [Balneolaceae bacterium]